MAMEQEDGTAGTGIASRRGLGRLFFQTNAALLERAAEALTAGDTGTAIDAAHSVRGAAQFAGYLLLAAATADAEAALRTGRWDLAREQIADAMRLLREKAQRPVAATGARSVLLVEDHLYVRRMMSARLEQASYEVTAVTGAEEALSIFPALAPDLVLTDLNLHGLSGLELAKTLRRAGGHGSRIPILVMSASDRPEDRLRSRSAGATAMIAKPFSIEAFAAIAGLPAREGQ